MKSRGFVNVSEEQEVHIFAKQMLIHRLFIGHYQERRYVDNLKSYRDVVVIDNSEDNLQRDLEIVKTRVENFYKADALWIGITGPNIVGAPSGHCVWVKLQNMAFGYYWFQIKQVKFLENQEVSLRLKCVRSVSPNIYPPSPGISRESLNESEDVSDTASVSTNSPTSSPTLGFRSVINSIHDLKIDEMTRNVSTGVLSGVVSVLSIENMKLATNFVVVLLLASITGALNLIKYMGDFSLKFMREFSILIQATTPIFLAIIDFFSKCVGGFYILISMLFRRAPPNRPPFEHPQRSIENAPPRNFSPPRNMYQRKRF